MIYTNCILWFDELYFYVALTTFCTVKGTIYVCLAPKDTINYSEIMVIPTIFFYLCK